MRSRILFILALLLVPTAFAINVELTPTSENIFIAGDTRPIEMELNITNFGEASTFQVYNLVGFPMEDSKTYLKKGEQKIIKISISTRSNIEIRGNYAIEFYIRNEKEEKTTARIKTKIIDFSDAMEIKIGDIEPGNEKITISIKNNMQREFENVEFKFNSDFFSGQKEISLEPNEEREFSFNLNKEDIDKLPNGFYTVETTIKYFESVEKTESKVKFIEKDSLSTSVKKTGFLIKKQKIEKTNTGNTQIRPEITVEKNIFLKYFTRVNPTADFIEREGMNAKYVWIKTMSPGEKITITVSTNWIYPLIILILLGWVIVFTSRHLFTDVIIKKKAKYLRTKGGEFALKITLTVKAQKYIERLNLIEKLPGVVNVYPKFGGEQPARVNEEKRRIDWRFEKMEAGEIKKVSYVLYSKVGIMGRLILPKSKAIYEKNGKIKKSSSNQCLLIS